MYEKNPSVRNRRYHCPGQRTPDGLKPVITSEEILTYVPDSRHYCEIDSIQILNIDSTNIQPSHWLAVSKAIEEHYEEYDGFVITHGTDTMAYTVKAFHLIQNSPKLIVITGAHETLDMENTDDCTTRLDSSPLPMTRLTGYTDGKVIA